MDPDHPTRETGYRICDQILAGNKKRWCTFSALWCWGCVTFTGGDRDKRCGSTYSCPQVLERYQRDRTPED